MKLLVIDDSKIHLKAAQVLLSKNHEVTVASTFAEAKEALKTGIDYDVLKKLQNETIGDFPREGTEAEQSLWREKNEELQVKASYGPSFDAVLTDLMMPAPKDTMGSEGMKFIGQEMPFGLNIAFRALQVGIKRVLVVTDTNHHHHPSSAALDMFGGRGTFQVGDATVFLTNYPLLKSFDAETFDEVTYDFLESEEGKRKYPETGSWQSHQGIVYAKGWDNLLAVLLNETVDSEE
jgi:CheY-like chemotaxis protein